MTPERVQDRPDSNTAAAHTSPPAAPARAARTGLAGGEAATTPVVPVASHADEPHRGARHGDAPPARLQSNGTASLSPAPARAAGPAAPSSDQGRPSAPLLPTGGGIDRANCPRGTTSRTAPVPVPVVAPAQPRPAASPASDLSQGGPQAELSAGPVTAAALLHPRRQRELIEQAAGMTTRQVTGLLATAAAQVVPPRDTLRAVAPDRYTLKVSIDQECEQGLRQLKNLRSHLDPRMSWGDLVARLVREAVARHDPRGGGRRRKRTGSTAASSRPGRTSAPAVVPAAARAGGGGDTAAPQGANAAARKQPRAALPPAAAPARGSAPTAPAAGATPADAKAPRTRADAAVSATTAAGAAPAVESLPTGSVPVSASAAAAAAATPDSHSAGAPVPCPAQGLRDRRSRDAEQTEPVKLPEQRNQASGAPRLTTPAMPSGGARQAGPSGAPAAAAAPHSISGGVAVGSDAAAILPGTPPAPKFAGGATEHGTDATPVPPGVPPALKFASDGTKHGTDGAPIPPGVPPRPEFGSGGTEHGSRAALAPPGTPPAPELAGGVPAVHGAGGTPGGSAPRFTRDAARGPRQSPLRRPIPAAVRRHVWLRDGGRCCYRDPLTGRRCNSSHLLQIDHLLPVAEGGGPEPQNLVLSCFAHHRMRHQQRPALPSEPSR